MEMTQRERLRDLAIFERLHRNPAKTSPNLAVKKVCIKRVMVMYNLHFSDEL